MLSVLGPQETLLMRKLDKIFESWGMTNGALPMTMPFLLPVEELSSLDVYHNFPHHAMVATSLNLQTAEEWKPNKKINNFQSKVLEPAALSIPSAACYSVYLHFKNQELPEYGTLITLISKCCRKEEKYEKLKRLLGFHMREVVALGGKDFTHQHLDKFSTLIFSFSKLLDLSIHKEPATDPFYDKSGSRLLMQKLSPLKHEFIVDNTAIASVNMHRNFFGQRCKITIKNTSEPIFSSCVAFGLERWLSALYKRYESWDKAEIAVDKALHIMHQESALPA